MGTAPALVQALLRRESISCDAGDGATWEVAETARMPQSEAPKSHQPTGSPPP
jgi:hypothetical protein